MLKNSVTMKVYTGVLVFTLIAITLSSAIPKPGEGKNRVVDKDLSDQKHFDGDDHDHNKEYDHEAFLGKDEAQTFDQLTPEESKNRLGLIYDKIDKDGDKQVSEKELQEWISHVQKHYVYSDTDRQWKEHDPEADTITWESYKKKTYGFLEEDEADKDDGDGYNYKDMIRRDERRWKKADRDGDNKLTKEEFADFLHPEEADHMRDIVVDETLEDIDKDKDGFISLEEYIGDMYNEADNKDSEEPEWVKSERDMFKSARDINKDGKMDREEIKKWILPSGFDHIESEAKHLIGEADEDKDGVLSKEEVLNKYDLFVGSQATDFGEALTRHTEL